MNKYIKYIAIIIIVIYLAIPFTSSYNVQSIDDLAYLVALGIDSGETNDLKITFEFTVLNSSGDNSSSNSLTLLNSVDSNSLDTAVSLMSAYIGKEINLSHCKAIIISEDLAANGISKLLYDLMNNVEIRPNTNIIISKCLAKDFIENTQTSVDTLIAKHYESITSAGKYTGYIYNSQIGDFFNKSKSLISQPVAILRYCNCTTFIKLYV